jgi:HK97 family phage major capsid protein
MNVKQIGDELQAKRTQLNELFKGYPDIPADRVADIQALNAEISDISKKYDAAVELEQAKAANDTAIFDYKTPANPMQFSGGKSERPAPVKSWQDVIRESKGYAMVRSGQLKEATIDFPEATEFKAVLTTADFNVVETRPPNVVSYAAEERTVADLMLQGTTGGNTITYMEETTFTNNAAEVAEAGAKPESVLDFTERTESVRKIATWIPATTEILDDVPMMMSYIQGRLRFMVERREEQQLLTGDGNAPNISGILDRAGIQTQAKGADPTPDAVYKAMTKVRAVGFAEPTAAVFHPNDWQDIRLLRTADGIYIWGSPSDAGPERIFGLEVRITTAMTENTALVGAFRPFAQIFRRQGIVIRISTEHDTYFTDNKVAILAESRLALAVYRPAAFATVTGI